MQIKVESSPSEEESAMEATKSTSTQSSQDDQTFKPPPAPVAPVVPIAPPAPILKPAPPATFAPPIPQTNMLAPAPAHAPTQAQVQDPYFIYKRNCRLAWIGYLGLFNKVKLREGPDGLPYFIGMPPEYSTSKISPDVLEKLQKEAMSNPRNSFICLQDGVGVFLADRNYLKVWEAAGSRNALTLLNSENPEHAAPTDTLTYMAILPVMNRLVGIQSSEEDPSSFPGYLPAMASFERAIWNGEKAKTLAQRRQYAEMALRALRKFMDSQKNEVIIERMMQLRRHYEALVATEKQERGGTDEK
ncbi:hypothetical protein ACHAP5_006511 [Fusarium lateritium]